MLLYPNGISSPPLLSSFSSSLPCRREEGPGMLLKGLGATLTGRCKGSCLSPSLPPPSFGPSVPSSLFSSSFRSSRSQLRRPPPPPLPSSPPSRLLDPRLPQVRPLRHAQDRDEAGPTALIRISHLGIGQHDGRRHRQHRPLSSRGTCLSPSFPPALPSSLPPCAFLPPPSVLAQASLGESAALCR